MCEVPMHLFMAVPMTPSAAVAQLRWPEITPFWFELNSTLRALEKVISGVVDTGEQFIACVIDTDQR